MDLEFQILKKNVIIVMVSIGLNIYMCVCVPLYHIKHIIQGCNYFPYIKAMLEYIIYPYFRSLIFNVRTIFSFPLTFSIEKALCSILA